MTAFYFFTTDRAGDSEPVNDYRTKQALAMLETSGANAWLELGHTPEGLNAALILVAGDSPLSASRVEEIAVMHDLPAYYLVLPSSELFKVDTKTGESLPMGKMQPLNPVELLGHVAKCSPYLSVSNSEGLISFYTWGDV